MQTKERSKENNMKLWNTPYRWSTRTIWKNISSNIWDITYGFKNIIRWIPIIWFDRDWDWSHLAQVMEYKLRLMSIEFEFRGHLVGSKINAKRCLIAAELCKRLREDEYQERAEKEFGISRCAFLISEQNTKDDKEYLGKLIGKYLNHWWD